MIDDVPNTITIGGVPVDINDPCDLCRALQAYRIKVATGGNVEEIEVRSPVSTRRTRFSAGSRLADIDNMIAETKAACEARLGAPPPRRKRFAMRGRMTRPY